MSLMRRGSGERVLRWTVAVAVLCLAAAPCLPLAGFALLSPSPRPVWTEAFRRSMEVSLRVGAGVSLFSLAIGLPLGLLAALYRFPARRLLVFLQALPLLLPSFLPCIGWSMFSAQKRGLSEQAGLFTWVVARLPEPDGLAGCIFVLGLQMLPLPFFATWAGCHHLTASQIDAARLHGGERAVLRLSARACAPVAVLAALLGGILSLSDVGAPLIFGARSVAVEVRTSFSALFDHELAGRQCLALAAVVLLLTAPVVLFGLRRLAAAVLARQTRPAAPHPRGALRWVALAGLLSAVMVGVVLPAVGLCLPAVGSPMIGRAWRKVADTAAATMVFTGGAGMVAVVLATLLALAVTSFDARPSGKGLRLTAVAVLAALLAMPPALAAIGVSRLATHAPPQLDWLTRSRLTVALVLGLRFLPVAGVVMMRAMGSLSPSWIDAARVHGVAPCRVFVRVVLPNVLLAAIVGVLLVMVLAAADITTTHLLEPPGVQSLPVAIFTVMANSPEALVAWLCLLYLLCVAVVLGAVAACQEPGLLKGLRLLRLSSRHRVSGRRRAA